MSKTESSVEELLNQIARGELRLPEMQRRYVWRATRVRDLLDSLYHGYPSGAILIWETDEQVPERDFAVEQMKNAYSSSKLLLDGQQRLTSLTAIINGKHIEVRGRKKKIDILFNLEHPDILTFVSEVEEDGNGEDDDDDDLDEEEVDASEDELQKRFKQMTFVVASKRLERLPEWVSVTKVFATDSDGPILQEAGLTGFDDPRYKKYSERLKQLRSIKKYMYTTHVLERRHTYEEVTEIFVRVNSLGAKLRSSDLALAQITATWRNSLHIFEEFQKECENIGFNLDTGILVRSLVAFATGQSRFRTVSGMKNEVLQENWNLAKEGVHFALNFLKSNVKMDSLALLSSPYFMITVAYFSHLKNYHLSARDEADLKYWLYVANAKGHYSRGSSETILDQDLTALKNGKGAAGLVDILKAQFGRLDFQPDDLEGRNRRSSIFKLMFLVFRHDGAKDWNSNLEISINHSGKQHHLQFHHIFPKARLKSKHTVKEINDIANLAFIGGHTNRKISAKAPETYFETILAKQGTSPFDKQCIPTDNELLTNYSAFLEARRERITKRLNDFLSAVRN